MGHAFGTWEAIQSLFPKGKKKILDVGCGTFLWFFPNYEIHRCDNNKEIMGFVRKLELEKYMDLNFKLVDLNKDFPYEDEEFDGLIAIEVIEHLENPRHFLKECKRIVKDFIIITTPNCLSPLSKKTFSETGRFHWFEEKDYQQSKHITPLFIWQIEQMLFELSLKFASIKYNNKKEEILILKIEK